MKSIRQAHVKEEKKKSIVHNNMRQPQGYSYLYIFLIAHSTLVLSTGRNDIGYL
jgi:hypothetical protein